MKGISETLIIVITVVVLLVAALILLTIFGGGVAPVADISSQTSICAQQGASSCQSASILPATWSVPMPVRQGGQTVMKSCSELVNNCNSCTNCGFPVPA